jgi:uncharacterized DUF497 family protein
VKISGFIWLEEIIEKLEHKHKVKQGEVHEVFARHPQVRFVEKGHRAGENVYAALGPTAAGRFLIVFFVLKHAGRALILSARDMTEAERRRYEQEA